MLYPFALERDEGYRSTSMFDQGSVDFGGKSEDCPFDGYMLNGKWGLLDNVTKKLIIPFCLDGLSEYRNGLGKVLYKGKLYFINHKGERLPSEASIGVDEFVNYT